MTKDKLIIALTCGLLTVGTLGFSQDCSKYIKENQELREQIRSLQTQQGIINDSEIEVKSVDSEVKFKILEVIGGKNEQAVTIKFQLFQETKPHQQVKIWVKDYGSQTKAYDDYGKEYEVSSGKLGNEQGGYIANQLPTGVPLNGELKFINILPTVTRLKMVMLGFTTKDFNGGANKVEGLMELKNLKIQWK